jgi:hypothetical protein
MDFHHPPHLNIKHFSSAAKVDGAKVVSMPPSTIDYFFESHFSNLLANTSLLASTTTLVKP